MSYCLECPIAFKSRYVKNPIIRKNIKACIYGFSVSATTVAVAVKSAGVAAGTAAASAGVAGILGHFASWPIIGGIAAKYVAGVAVAASSAALFPAFISILPVAIIIWLSVYLIVFLLIRKKTAPYQKGSGLDNLAKFVGKIIFLPLLAESKKIIESNPKEESKARKFIIEKIHDWCYSDEYAKNLVDDIFAFPSETIISTYNFILEELNKLKKNELYNGIHKYEIPPKGIQKLAEEIKNVK